VSGVGKIVKIPHLGGLHHRYQRFAALKLCLRTHFWRTTTGWFDLALLEERQLFAKKQILRSQGVVGADREQSEPDQVAGCRR